MWGLEHLDAPGPKFFQAFGKRLPPAQWPDGSTKQGVYSMTADGEVLGAHFGRHGKEQTVALLTEALKTWNELAAKKGLKPQAIPGRAKSRFAAHGVPARAGGTAGANAVLTLQVNSRDLPRADGKFAGPPEYRTAWNQNWLDFTAPEAAGFLPKDGARTHVPAALFGRIAREMLVDNVRGQTGSWPDAAIRKAVLTTETVSTQGDLMTLRFEGEFHGEEPGRSFACKLHGKAVYNTRTQRFTLFELAAAGTRTGGVGQANFRTHGEGASALGISFIIAGQYD